MPCLRGPARRKRLCEAEPIAPVREIKPVLIRKCRLKEYITRGDVVKEAKKNSERRARRILYDFGVNSAGTVKLRISGERGRQIDLQFGEYFAPDGEPDTKQHLLLSRRIFPARYVHT